LGFGILRLMFGDLGLGFRVWGLGVRVRSRYQDYKGFGVKFDSVVYGLGLRFGIPSFGVRVLG
jgi:hypothetical protein